MDEHADALRAMHWGIPASQDLRARWQPHCGVAGLVIAIVLGEEWSGAAYSILEPDVVPQIETVPYYAGRLSPRAARVKADEDIFREWRGVASGVNACRSSRNRLRERFDNAAVFYRDHSDPDECQETKAKAKPSEASVDPVEQPKAKPSVPSAIPLDQAAIPLLRYLASHTSKYMQRRHAHGAAVIQRHGDANVHYVICTPFRLHVTMQAQLRRACVQAGLITPERAHTVAFVSHVQAIVSSYAAVPGGYADSWPTRLDDTFVLCDVQADGVTLSYFSVMSPKPLSVKETQPLWCWGDNDHEHTLEKQARSLLRYRLAGTPWDNDIDIDDLQLRLLDVCSFASFADDGDEDVCIQFAPSSKYNDAQLGVRRGKLVFSRHEIRALFQPIVKTIEQRLRPVCHPTRPLYVIASGGAFTERSDLYRTLQKRMGTRIILCATPASIEHNQFERVVPSGAVAWLLRSWGA